MECVQNVPEVKLECVQKVCRGGGVKDIDFVGGKEEDVKLPEGAEQKAPETTTRTRVREYERESVRGER